MTYLLYVSSVLLVLLGVIHSVLGERYILIRLFRRDNLPKLFGGTEYTINTLRFAWHITSIAWFGFAVMIIYISKPTPGSVVIGNIVGVTFLGHFIVALIGSKGKHFSWPIFLFIAVSVLLSVN